MGRHKPTLFFNLKHLTTKNFSVIIKKTINGKRIENKRIFKMSLPTLYISCGVPGSGKSTFLKKNKKEDEIIVSRDEIRFNLLKKGDAYFKNEKQVYNLFIQKIGKELSIGKNVYADATHLNENSREKLLNNLKKFFPNLNFNIEIIFFKVPLHICLERNNKRDGREKVPENLVVHMFNLLDKSYTNYAKHLWIIDENGIVYKEW